MQPLPRMLLGFKTQLKINGEARVLLAQHAGTARHAYNWGLALCQQILAHNLANPEEKIKLTTAIDLHKWLVARVKPEFPWYYESSKCAPQYALKHLREAWDRCFSKIAGQPNFKKKGEAAAAPGGSLRENGGRDDTFTEYGTIKVIDQRQIQVPVIGILKTYERLPFGYKPSSVTISRQADKWFISFKIEVLPKPTDATEAVGVDLGLLRFATLSSGEEIESPRPYKQLERQLAS